MQIPERLVSNRINPKLSAVMAAVGFCLHVCTSLSKAKFKDQKEYVYLVRLGRLIFPRIAHRARLSASTSCVSFYRWSIPSAWDHWVMFTGTQWNTENRTTLRAAKHCACKSCSAGNLTRIISLSLSHTHTHSLALALSGHDHEGLTRRALFV
jgi:hypothetical protein